MAMRVRFQYPTGSQLSYSIERLEDGLFYDFSTSTFVATPVELTSKLPEDTGPFAGRFKLTLTTPPAIFTDGDYCITVHDTNTVVCELASTIFDGDDASINIIIKALKTVLVNLAPTAFDEIEIEEGVNARQALSPILAASGGVTSGAGTGTIVIQGANTAINRITATIDKNGNRSKVVLSMPE